MAENLFKPLQFNEGAPLDPTDLNTMQTNILASLGESLSNSSGSSTYTLKTDCYYEEITGMQANKPTRVSVPVPGFTDKAIVVATPAPGNVIDGEQITVIVNKIRTGMFDIVVTSSAKRSQIIINWIISERTPR